MKAKEEFISMLWKINLSDVESIEDLQSLIKVQMFRYGVRYKDIREIGYDDYCMEKFKGDVEAWFLDEINVNSINYYDFQRYCLLFMDFERLVGERSGHKTMANVIRMNTETRFGLNL